MRKRPPNARFTRREMLQLSAAATALGGAVSRSFASPRETQASAPANPYFVLLKSWCDALVALQVKTVDNPALHGGILCPACARIHGRCADALYPLLHMAHSTGDAKYAEAAVLAQRWSDQVARPDGSWVDDVTLNPWKGITVFGARALAEALQYHGSLLDLPVRSRWKDRLARAAKFLDGFVTMETGNINYPVSSSACFAVLSEVLEEPRYLDRARQFARASLEYFTPNHLLFGEGHPQTRISPKKCRAVDLGYNVEESLPSLAVYALIAGDQPVLDQVIAALRAHMEFMTPDGGWDNSWGTRNFKWTWWGSRTSDGCHPAYALLARHDARFREVARRNLEQMAGCTHEGLLYGGPDYYEHGDLPCVHHTFTHAKALAEVLDRAGADSQPAERSLLPRDEAYGLKSYPEIGTHLAAIGGWRATVTDYDWEYAKTGGGHASGGALALLFHQELGPILVASMTEYQMVEISNQQIHGDYPTMPLTPRMESADERAAYTSLNDLEAALTVENSADAITFESRGRLQTPSHQSPPGGDVHYHLTYRLTKDAVEIAAAADGPGPGPLQLIVPVICRRDEAVEKSDPKNIRIAKPKGRLMVRTDAPDGFGTQANERVFNLVPGFECIPLAILLEPGKQARIEIRAVAPPQTQ